MRKRLLSFLLVCTIFLCVPMNYTLADSDTSHTATKCTYPKIVMCTDGYTCNGPNPCSKPGEREITIEDQWHTCPKCGDQWGMINWTAWECKGCSMRVKSVYTSVGCSCGFATGSTATVQKTTTYDHLGTKCSHGKTEAHSQICEHGYYGSHPEEQTACSTHTRYPMTTHYYCDTHGYVGTSSTCPGVSIEVNPSIDKSSIQVGETAQITPNASEGAAVTFSSADTSIATVDTSGLVTGLRVGTTTINVTASK